MYEVLTEKYEWDAETAQGFTDWLTPMLAFDSDERATAEECLAHPFLADVTGLASLPHGQGYVLPAHVSHMGSHSAVVGNPTPIVHARSASLDEAGVNLGAVSGILPLPSKSEAVVDSGNNLERVWHKPFPINDSDDNEIVNGDEGENDNAVLARMAELAAAKHRAIDSLNMLNLSSLEG